MFNPLLAVALLPLALLWFGLGNASLVFVIVHSVLWAVALNTQSRVFVGVADDAHGRAPLWIKQAAVCDNDSDPGSVLVDTHRYENRLGFRLAHVDRCATGVWRVVGFRRPGLVHLPSGWWWKIGSFGRSKK